MPPFGFRIELVSGAEFWWALMLRASPSDLWDPGVDFRPAPARAFLAGLPSGTEVTAWRYRNRALLWLVARASVSPLSTSMVEHSVVWLPPGYLKAVWREFLGSAIWP